MKRKCLALLLPALLASNVTWAESDDWQLQQVLIISRHGLRAPLTDASEQLTKATPHQWPHWQTAAGRLTTKGGALEVFMGGWLRDWFDSEKLTQQNRCPASEQVDVYTNVIPRTIATGQFIVNGAFPGCEIALKNAGAETTKDPLFYQAIKNDDPAFINESKQQIQQYIKQSRFDQDYALLERVIDYRNADDCKKAKQCHLSQQQNQIQLVKDKEPEIDGPLHNSFYMVDAFMLQYYQGFADKDVAWGNIRSDKEWRSLAKLRNGYIEATYLQPAVANNIIQPLLKRVASTLLDGNTPISLLVGHDTTVGPLMTAMAFNDYTLPGQYEKTPIGGKLLFERWHNRTQNRDYLKVEYVYQSADQLRHLTPLSLETPPQRVTLSLKGCAVDNNGFCPWETFSQDLRQRLK